MSNTEVFKSYRDESRANYGKTRLVGSYLSNEDVQLGAILRIADASEAMAKNHVALQNEADRYKRWYNEERANSAKLNRQNAALRGQITKLRKRLGIQ